MKRLWISVGALVTLTACGGSNAGEVFDNQDSGAQADSTDATSIDDAASPDTGGTDSTSSSDTAPVDATPPVTLDNVCSRLAEGICGKAANTCCVKSGLAFDEPGCRKNTQASCAESVAAVRAGTKTFDPAALGACIDAWGKLETACTVNAIEFGRTYPPCQQLFNGKVAPGAACKTDDECVAAPGSFADCSDPAFLTASVCKQFTVVGNGASCSVGGDVQALCDLGLYCAISSFGSTKGTCRPAKKLGDACNAAVWWECGYGFVCSDPGPFGTPKCAAGAAAGAFCSRESECASWSCVSNRCGATSFPIASREICGGA